jgi:aminoglycoside/choline kinase family phosphotransferase
LSDRQQAIADFLKSAGWTGAERRKLAGDASFRKYDRVFLDGRRAVLMDAPPPQEDVRPFVGIARHLTDLGLSAPRILAEDVERGFLLLEDLGDDTYTRMLAAGADEGELYALATDVLIDLHRHADALPDALPAYDDDRLLTEAGLLTDWYMPEVLGRPTPDDLRGEFVQLWRDLFPAVHAQPATLVLRDYHVDNLMWLPERKGSARCGLLDFQDAVAGAGAYDLMSLVEDARRDIADDLRQAMIDRYLAAFPGMDRGAFLESFAILAAQRHAKVIGIFTRLCRRDGKPGYLVHIPRVWRLLERACAHPALAPVAAWLDRHIPGEKREIPPCPKTPS